MKDSAAQIRQSLRLVHEQRRARAADAALLMATQAVKAFQHRRFQHSYADLLNSPRYGPACEFFLSEIYGERDFSARDQQFEKVVGALVRLFPGDLVDTVCRLCELHALSEDLDTRMARQLGSDARLRDERYGAAWRAVGQPELRRQQIELLYTVGSGLDRFAHKPLLAQTMRMMRGPAKTAGLSSLQAVLESGLSAFKAMRGAEDFLRTVIARETQVAAELFAGN